MVSAILALILIAGFIYSLPFLLVNSVILSIFVFLTRRKTGWILNALILYMGVNQLRKGIVVWGLLFLILGLIKTLNFVRIGKSNSKNAEYKENYRKAHRQRLINQFFTKVKDKMEDIEFERQDKYEDYEIDPNKSNEKGKRVITLEDRERLGKYKQQRIVRQETKDQMDEAIRRKEAREREVASKVSQANSNIPRDIDQQLRSEKDKSYKDALFRMSWEYNKEMSTPQSYKESLKQLLKAAGSEARSTLDIFNLSRSNDDYYENYSSYENNYMEFGMNNGAYNDYNDCGYIEDNSDPHDISWVESQDIDFEADMNTGINVYSRFDFDYKDSVMGIINKEQNRINNENNVEVPEYESEFINNPAGKITHIPKSYTDKLTNNRFKNRFKNNESEIEWRDYGEENKDNLK